MGDREEEAGGTDWAGGGQAKRGREGGTWSSGRREEGEEEGVEEPVEVLEKLQSLLQPAPLSAKQGGRKEEGWRGGRREGRGGGEVHGWKGGRGRTKKE